MRAMLRVLVALVIAAGMTLATTAAALACTCAIQSEKEAFGRADVVIVGVIVGRNDPAFGLPVLSTGDPIAYTVRVEEVVKGDADEQVEMTSARSSTSCGLEMSVGQRWRLYASGDNQLQVGVCSGSQLLADAVSPAEGDPHAAPAMVLLLALVFAMIRLLARF